MNFDCEYELEGSLYHSFLHPRGIMIAWNRRACVVHIMKSVRNNKLRWAAGPACNTLVQHFKPIMFCAASQTIIQLFYVYVNKS